MKRILFSFALLSLIAVACAYKASKPYYYNVYSPSADEFYIVMSDEELDKGNVVWVNDNAEVCNYPSIDLVSIREQYTGPIHKPE